jgi:hypothetical protein
MVSFNIIYISVGYLFGPLRLWWQHFAIMRAKMIDSVSGSQPLILWLREYVQILLARCKSVFAS